VVAVVAIGERGYRLGGETTGVEARMVAVDRTDVFEVLDDRMEMDGLVVAGEFSERVGSRRVERVVVASEGVRGG